MPRDRDRLPASDDLVFGMPRDRDRLPASDDLVFGMPRDRDRLPASDDLVFGMPRDRDRLPASDDLVFGMPRDRDRLPASVDLVFGMLRDRDSLPASDGLVFGMLRCVELVIEMSRTRDELVFGTPRASDEFQTRDLLCKDDNGKSDSKLFLWQGYMETSCDLKSFPVFSSKKIKRVSIGADHSLFLTSEEEVYAYGSNSHGQLGLGDYEDQRNQPVLVKSLCDKGVCDIECGSNHSAAVCNHGDLYCWGDSTNGQCGTGSSSKVVTPVLVEFNQETECCEHGVPFQIEKVEIKQISCGVQHSLALSKQGELWVFGEGKQLGLGDKMMSSTPVCLESLQGRRILSVHCGAMHSIALLERSRPSSAVDTHSKHINLTPVKTHKYYPSTCVICNKEIYSYTDTSDTCIINSYHTCETDLESSIHLSLSSPTLASSTSGLESETSFMSDEPQACDSVNSQENKLSESDNKDSMILLENKSNKQDGNKLASETPGFTEEAKDADVKEESHIRNSDEESPEVIKADESDKTEIFSKSSEPDSNNRTENVDNNTSGDVDQKDVKNNSDSANKHDEDEVWVQSNIPRSSSITSASSLLKSKSSLLDETDARDFLSRQLGEADKEKSSSAESPAKSKIGSFFSHSTFSSMTSAINSMKTTVVDKFSFVSGPTVELDSFSKTSSQEDSVELEVAPLPQRTVISSEGSLPKSSDGRRDSRDQIAEVPVFTEGDPQQGNKRASLAVRLFSHEEGMHESEATKYDHPVCIETEVWSWGKNSKGQLGLGDQVDRSKPSCIKMFSNRNIVRISTGTNHNLAVTASSQVYTWGQLMSRTTGGDDNIFTPHKMRFPEGSCICDVAGADKHSLFLIDGVENSSLPEVFFLGKQPSEDVYAPARKTTKPELLKFLVELGYIRGIWSGGSQCACIISQPLSALDSAVFKLASSEKRYHQKLSHINAMLLRPLHKSAFYTSLDVFPYKSALLKLLDRHQTLQKRIGEGIVELSRLIRNGDDFLKAQLFDNYDIYIDAFKAYSRTYSDMLAMGGFEYCTKTGSSFFETKKDFFNEYVESKTQEKMNYNVVFSKIMGAALNRLEDYTYHCGCISAAINKEKEPDTANLLNRVTLNWDSLKYLSNNEIKIAENTRAFWDGYGPRHGDSLKVARRRLLRDSRTHPLLLTTAGRFVSHTFLLFTDIFVHSVGNAQTVYQLEKVWVEAVSDSDQIVNSLVITTPEDTMVLSTVNSADKAEWLMGLNQAINKVLLQKSQKTRHGSSDRLTPPLVRHSNHTFIKNSVFKDAKYCGSWLYGKMHGQGVLTWPDGKTYNGRFKQGSQHGPGKFVIKGENDTEEIQEGNWKDGQLNGLGKISYANGDKYEGYFKDGQRFGHGVFRQGRHTSSGASVYIGEWMADRRNGYGVMDVIYNGEKHMGMWQDNCRHGNGIVVTLDGMYFEGKFIQNKLQGFGLMLTDDNSSYEGEFADITQLSGKGTLTMPNGDKIEGQFSGSWNEGLKINGNFKKCFLSAAEIKKLCQGFGAGARTYGTLSVPASLKWGDIFSHCWATLGYPGIGKADSAKAWEVVAVMVTAGKKTLKDDNESASLFNTPAKIKRQVSHLEQLEKIPPHGIGHVTVEYYEKLVQYLSRAFDTPFHPLGKLMEGLVDVFRAAYIGVGAHPRLLYHAVEEVRSFVLRIYKTIRLFFPDLPLPDKSMHIYPEAYVKGDVARESGIFSENGDSDNDENDENSVVISATGLLHPILLPKIYPPLFDLYALYNDKDDEKYWERVQKLNRQGDMALMAYLGIDQKFWLIEDSFFQDTRQKLSSLKEHCYASPVDALQHLSTAFSPTEKLKVIHKTFLEITKAVCSSLGEDYVWCMDELFPIFQYVVVRSKIRHLGAEIQMIDDLMEQHLEYGELGIMFTTLKACYFQIQTEKMPNH